MAAALNGHTNGIFGISSLRARVENALGQIIQLLQAAKKSIHPDFVAKPSNDVPEAKGGILADIKKIGIPDVETLLESFYDSVRGAQDDNSLLMERLIQLLVKLPSNSKDGQILSDTLINNLWNTLPHPPTASLGTRYKYREPDGSFNNINQPVIGKADTPYARSVKPVTMQKVALPDPGAIFDSLMARGNTFEPHPNGISSLLFYQATIIIHDLFRTDHSDFNNSKTSSYLDLAPLYGSNLQEQTTMRTFQEGKLKPDCFSEKRLLGFPPGVGVLLIMYNRMHNYIVTQLSEINENNRFRKPKDGASKEQWEKYDNDLFQTARLINCGFYVNVILKDYVRTILSLNRTSSTWDLDPRAVQTKTLLNNPAPEGVGNQISAEFNLIYRWHSAISQRDDKWTQDEYSRLFPGKNPKDVTLQELIQRLTKLEQDLSSDPLKRPFANLTRLEDGTFDDDGLVDILAASIDDVAGAFGANRVPDILKSVEILGIIQARSWNLASLNEFRQFFGLTKHTTFEDINPDPLVAQKLRNLYDHPDSVELYPGLVAEKPKPPMSPGSGLCVNFSTSRAILSDAVTLVRGDRFFTTDYTPKNLTNWGFAWANYDLKVDQGCVLYKLFYRAFPNHFKGNSIWAHFPFVVPSENKKIQDNLGTAHLYDWSPPIRTPELIVVNHYKAATTILDDKQNFKVTWGESIEYVVQHPGKHYGRDYCLAGDNAANTASRKLVMRGLYPADWNKEVKNFYEDITTKLLKQYSYQIAGVNQVDIVRDVANLANTHFSASVFSLPLKTDEHPHGIFNEQELYQVLSILFLDIFYDIDPAQSFELRNAAQELAQGLGNLCLFNAEAIARTGVIADLISSLHAPTALSEYGTHMIQRLLESGQSIKDVVWTQLVPTAASMVANQAQLLAQTLDYYLDEGSKHLKELNRLAKLDTPEADELILRYFLEGSRLRATVGLFRDAATDVIIQDGDASIHIPQGRRVLVNVVRASLDPLVFADPLEVRLDRDLKSYIHYGWGPHQCAGLAASKVAMTALFKTVVRLDNLRRAPGPQGELKKLHATHGYTSYMTPDWSAVSPLPTTLVVQWDGPALA